MPSQSFNRAVRPSAIGTQSVIEDNQLPVFSCLTSRPSIQTVPQAASPSVDDSSAPAEDCFDDYINASWIDSCLRKKLLIAASAPKKNTVCDFLHMIIQNNVKLVMKVCDDKVGRHEQCFKYTGKN